eukprot:scaffold28702_cov62-Phaeocystis_antarctica.AAC.5
MTPPFLAEELAVFVVDSHAIPACLPMVGSRSPPDTRSATVYPVDLIHAQDPPTNELRGIAGPGGAVAYVETQRDQREQPQRPVLWRSCVDTYGCLQ